MKLNLAFVVASALAGLSVWILPPGRAQDAPATQGSEPAPRSFNRPHGGGGRGQGHGHHDQFIQQLLTADQKTKYDAIMQQASDESAPLKQQLKDLQAKSGTDTDQKMQGLRDQLAQQHKAVHAKVMALLTPDQQKQLQDMKMQRRKARSQSDDMPAKSAAPAATDDAK